MSAVSLIVDIVITIIVLIIVLPILASAIRVVPEYQRLVKLRLGKFKGVYGPGIVFVVPLIDRVITVDLRTIMIDMPSQRALTRDNVEVSIDASVYLRVLDAKNTVL
ncbi:MAG: SPFH domain-containing protein, partial [Caldivirga sp.]